MDRAECYFQKHKFAAVCVTMKNMINKIGKKTSRLTREESMCFMERAGNLFRSGREECIYRDNATVSVHSICRHNRSKRKDSLCRASGCPFFDE